MVSVTRGFTFFLAIKVFVAARAAIFFAPGFAGHLTVSPAMSLQDAAARAEGLAARARAAVASRTVRIIGILLEAKGPAASRRIVTALRARRKVSRASMGIVRKSSQLKYSARLVGARSPSKQMTLSVRCRSRRDHAFPGWPLSRTGLVPIRKSDRSPGQTQRALPSPQ